jgi:hypothetical protein
MGKGRGGGRRSDVRRVRRWRWWLFLGVGVWGRGREEGTGGLVVVVDMCIRSDSRGDERGDTSSNEGRGGCGSARGDYIVRLCGCGCAVRLKRREGEGNIVGRVL